MDKCISFYFTLFLVAVIIATVTSFGGGDANNNNNNMGGFGGDYFNRNYQNWLDKRGLGQAYGGFGSPLGSENRYFNWKDYLANGLSKRQLSYGSRSFGSVPKYFSGGLQDWKTSYTGINKREATSQDDSNSPKTDA